LHARKTLLGERKYIKRALAQLHCGVNLRRWFRKGRREEFCLKDAIRDLIFEERLVNLCIPIKATSRELDGTGASDRL
jgi:hypothetical protein